MLVFNERKRLAAQFEQWCKDNGVLCCASAMVLYLEHYGLLDENAVREFLKGETPTKADGLKSFVEVVQ